LDMDQIGFETLTERGRRIRFEGECTKNMVLVGPTKQR